MSDRTPPGVKDPAGGRGNRWVLGCAGIVVGMAVLIGGCTAIVVANSDGHDSNTEYEAIAQCEAAVEKRLKAPATAEFNSTAAGGGPWIVSGTVDAENGFGAMIRNEFQCKVTITGDRASVTLNYLE